MSKEHVRLTELPYEYKWCFIGLFLIFLITVMFIKFSKTDWERRFDEKGERIWSENEKHLKGLYDNPNCSVTKSSDGKIKAICPGLPEKVQTELNDLLNSPGRASSYSSLSDKELTETANHFVRNYAFWGKLEVELGGDDFPKVVWVLILSFICLIIGILVLAISLPVYLFSENPERSKKAGGLVKTSLGFITAVGTTLIASFVKM